jgi:hypothetical protein
MRLFVSSSSVCSFSLSAPFPLAGFWRGGASLAILPFREAAGLRLAPQREDWEALIHAQSARSVTAKTTWLFTRRSVALARERLLGKTHGGGDILNDQVVMHITLARVGLMSPTPAPRSGG